MRWIRTGGPTRLTRDALGCCSFPRVNASGLSVARTTRPGKRGDHTLTSAGVPQTRRKEPKQLWCGPAGTPPPVPAVDAPTTHGKMARQTHQSTCAAARSCRLQHAACP
jgi:hypothetical protein